MFHVKHSSLHIQNYLHPYDKGDFCASPSLRGNFTFGFDCFSNTNIVLGCFEENQILFRERLSTNQSATALEYAAGIRMALDMHQIDKTLIDHAIISSVVPSVTAAVRSAVEKYTGKSPLIVGAGIQTGLHIMIDNPAQLGSDGTGMREPVLHVTVANLICM